MAKNYNVNFTPSTGAEAMYELKNVMTGSGWTVISSSDGSTFSAGDNITSPTSLAGSSRWFIIQEPTGAGSREWCFQRTSDNATWRVKISPYGGFGGGSPSLTQVPSATDEGLIVGSGTDASPTGGQLFPSDGTYKFHMVSDNTAIGPAGNQAYGFWAFANIIGSIAGTNIKTLIMQEPLAVGSYPSLNGTRAATTSGEADPAIYACAYDGSGYKTYLNYGNNGSLSKMAGSYTENDNTVKYFYSYQNASGSFTNGDEILGFQQGVGYLGVSPVSSEDVLMPLAYGRYATGVNTPPYHARATYTGFKGMTHFIRKSSVNRSASDTVNLTTDAYIYANQVLIPWPENVTPVF